jgi:hypothetical protein
LTGNTDILNYNSWALRYLIETHQEDLIQILVKNSCVNIHKSIKDIISSTKNENIKNKIIFHEALGYKFLLFIMSSYQNLDYTSLLSMLPKDMIFGIIRKLF